MVIDCKKMATTSEYFKERPEDIIWYKLYRNDRMLIYQNKKKYFDDFLEISEIPVCLRLYKFFLKVGKTYINMKEVNGCIVEPYRKESDNELYHLIISFKSNPSIYIDLDDHHINNVIEWQQRIFQFLYEIKSGKIR